MVLILELVDEFDTMDLQEFDAGTVYDCTALLVTANRSSYGFNEITTRIVRLFSIQF
jgi:hypothetical protein